MTTMLKSKTIDRICCLAAAVMLIVTAVVWGCKASAGRQATVEVGYEGLFDQETVHTIEIEISDWESLIATASGEEYVECSVTIDGEKINNVGIRAKGNTSLSSVATLGSEKYSFKIEFNHYVKGRLYKGLDKLSLNNLIYDATMMKDYLAYTLMAKMGVPSPLCSYAQITVNGEAWGLYLAVEGVEDGFMERNNMTTGELYKPDSLSFGGGRGNGEGFDFEQFRVKDDETGSEDAAGTAQETQDTSGSASAGGFSFPDGMTPPDGSFSGFSGQRPEGMSMPEGMSPPGGMSLPEGFEGKTPPTGGSGSFTPPDSSDGNGFTFSMPNFGGKFNFGMGSSDVKLAYIDDDPESYSNIFDNAKTKISKKDKKRLISALKTLSSENAQDAVFTDEVIAYLAVHDFLQNDDSYTGMMVHNYYLYEEDGKLAIIPWDYNLAFGGMGAGGDASSTVNSPIDSPVSSGTTGDRPLISWIFESEEAQAQYHEVYSRFISEVIESGWLAEEISRVAALIRPCVESDANSFYSAEEFDKATEALQSYCALRGESVRGQLDGTIPSTTEGQRADSSALVDTGDLNLSDMGVMNTGGGDRQGGGPGGGMPGGNMPSMQGGGSMPSMPQDGSMPSMPEGFSFGSGSFDPSSFGSGSFTLPGNMNTGTAETEAAAGTTVTNTAETEAAAGNTAAETAEKTAEAAAPAQAEERQNERKDSFRPGFDPSGNMGNAQSGTNWILFGILAAVLLAAILLIMKLPGRER